MNSQRHLFSRRQRGLTLVESLMGLAITAVIVGLSVPSFGASRERRNLEGAAAQLETDIQLARSEAVASNANVRLNFMTVSGGSCYVLHTGHSNDCQCGPAGDVVCSHGSTALRSAYFGAGGTVRAQSNVTSMVYDGSNGTVSPTGTVRLVGNQGKELRVVVNIRGRARTCAVQKSVPGYPAC